MKKSFIKIRNKQEIKQRMLTEKGQNSYIIIYLLIIAGLITLITQTEKTWLKIISAILGLGFAYLTYGAYKLKQRKGVQE